MLRVYDTGLSGKLLRCENWCTETITEDHHQNVKLWIMAYMDYEAINKLIVP